ncbi:MAG: TonB-dependent receptor [Acidobacteria bacterium]|nr:TonB-dependent receptor [Acidobacteriota bacterium]
MSKSIARVRRLLSFCVIGLLGIGPAAGQVTTAKFFAAVHDPSGAAIQGALVILTNEGTNAAYKKTTDAGGEVIFDVLPVGSYSIMIEAPGFKRFQSKGIALAASQQAQQTFTLEVGAVTETVTVEGTAPLVSTTSSEQRESLTNMQVVELPISRRNVTSVLRVAPGVDVGGGSVRINGQGKSGAVVTVDGTDANANPSEGRAMEQYGGRNYIDVMSIDAVQEVQLIRGILPAEYGGAISGQVNLISKSGSNAIHGSLFHLYRSHLFSARNPFRPSRDSSGRQIPKDREVYNQFGGSVGGPVVRDRLFFFTAYEGYRESVFQRVTGTAPTDSFRAEMLRALPFPEMKLLMDLIPRPTVILDQNRGRFEGAGNRTSKENHVVARADFRPTQAGNLSFTYTRNRPFGLNPSYFLNGANDRTYDYLQDRYTGLYTHAGTSWVFETRFGYNHADMSRLDNFFTRTDPNGRERVEWQRRVPRVGVRGIATFGGAEVWLMEGTTYSFDQKVSRHMGKHLMKFGARYVYYGGSRTNPENPVYVFNNKDDMFANLPVDVTISYGSHGPHKSRMYEAGLFVQDDWRATSRLTLNLGLRYDYYSNAVVTPTGDVDVGIKNLEPPTNWPAFNFGARRPFDRPIENDGWVNLGPRFGFAYKVDGAGKTVVRGGYGVLFAAHVPAVLRQSTAHPDVPFRIRWSKAEAQRLGVRYPMYAEDTLPIAIRDVQTTGNELVFSLMDPNLQNPYTMHYQLNVQRELSRNLMWEIGFVGVRGVKFPMHRPFNLPDRFTGVRPNPKLIPGGPYYVDNSENTTYSSLQTSLRKRFSRNLSFDVHYTWGKTMAYSGGDVGVYYGTDAGDAMQDFFNLAIERGHPNFDHTHRMVADWIYQLPYLQDWNPVLRGVLGGWQVSGIFSGQTGVPTRVTQPCSQGWRCRTDYVGGPVVLANWQDNEIAQGCRVGVHCDVQYLNRAAFAMVPTTRQGIAERPGTVGNNSLIRVPGSWGVDMSLAKNFQVREGMRLQFRVDTFNSLNHVNLGGLNTALQNSDFGRLDSAGGMRSMQLGARLSF